jgi:hypothetical protein
VDLHGFFTLFGRSWASDRGGVPAAKRGRSLRRWVDAVAQEQEA